MNKSAISIILLLVGLSCTGISSDNSELDTLAMEYVKLGLLIGQYDANFVDAYYGPDSLRPEIVSYEEFPEEMLLEKTETLQGKIKSYLKKNLNEELHNRARNINAELIAFAERIRIVAGNTRDFDEESLALFGVKAPHYSEEHFQASLKKLDSFLPGEGPLPDRFQSLVNKFIIPVEKLDTVIRATISEARKRTHAHYPIPKNESFSLEYVTDKAWSGYNWYQGNYTSLIQINTDFPITTERIINVASHESYPGHHVYNMLLEENLYNEKGYVELSLYPLFSPQSFIAEGSANFGIEVAFPGNDKLEFSKNILLPLAGLDTTGVGLYYKALEIMGELNYVRNEVARNYFNGTMNEKEAINWLVKYGLYTPEKALQSLRFTEKYRSYIINYNYGKDIVKTYIEKQGGTAEYPQKRWDLFGELLSKQILPVDLIKP